MSQSNSAYPYIVQVPKEKLCVHQVINEQPFRPLGTSTGVVEVVHQTQPLHSLAHMKYPGLQTLAFPLHVNNQGLRRKKKKRSHALGFQCKGAIASKKKHTHKT